MDYSYWETHVKEFRDRFGSSLAIENCSLSIEHDYARIIPETNFGNIFMPKCFLDLLNKHCNLILCNRNLFHNIGNYDKEELDAISCGFTESDLKSQVQDSILSIKMPYDDRRKKIAGMLRDMMTYFAIYHEIGHIRQNSFEPTNEAGYRERDNINWDEHAWEIDADTFAINWLWRTALINYQRFKPDETFCERNEIIEFCLYSTVLFFYLSDSWNNLSGTASTHPHPVVRFKRLSNILETIVTDNFSVDNDFYATTDKVLREFDKTRIYHFKEVNPREYYDKIKRPEINLMIFKLEEHLKKNLNLNCNRPYSID